MKQTPLLIVIFALAFGNIQAQCQTALKAKSENYVEGSALMHQEITDEKTEIPVVLNAKLTYGFYIFAKAGNSPPNVKFYAANGNLIEDKKLNFNKEANFRYWKFQAPASGKYKLVLENPDNHCALYVLSFISQ